MTRLERAQRLAAREANRNHPESWVGARIVGKEDPRVWWAWSPLGDGPNLLSPDALMVAASLALDGAPGGRWPRPTPVPHKPRKAPR